MGYQTEIASQYSILKQIASNLGFEFEVDDTQDDYIFFTYPIGSTRALGSRYQHTKSEDIEPTMVKVFVNFILTIDEN